MDLQHRHQIERECERLVYMFLRFFEDEHSKAADLFAEDGQFNTLVGADNIRKEFLIIEKRAVVELNALVATNLLVYVIDENNAKGFSYVTHYQHRFKDEKREGPPVQTPTTPIMSWTYEFKRVGSDWKFSKLEIGAYFHKRQ